MKIGDTVRLLDKRYKTVEVGVVGVNCDRITIARRDQYGVMWHRYVDISEIELVDG